MELTALVGEFLVDCRARRLAPRTVKWYDDNLRAFLQWMRVEEVPLTLSSFTLTLGRRYSQWLSERLAQAPTGVDSVFRTSRG